tara:strand:+ start:14465 stop:15271 length:807 start_codon:yes stop_codon:yes gene_type:complete
MNKISKYFSLLKFSLKNPKSGAEMIKIAQDTQADSKEALKIHSVKGKTLDKLFEDFFPDSKFTKSLLRDEVHDLEIRLKKFLNSLENDEFPSQKKPYPTDYSIQEDSRLLLYGLCRITQPLIVVETGVAYGISSSYILHALKKNGKGTLYSIDDTFRPWETKKMIGAAIPNELKENWELIVGKSSDKLKEISSSMNNIDIFLHDSLHTYKNMFFEFNLMWPCIKKNGFLLSDDISDNNAFFNFYSTKKIIPNLLKNKNEKISLGILKK